MKYWMQWVVMCSATATLAPHVQNSQHSFHYSMIWVFPKNRDTPKWMVCNGNPYWNGWFGGTTIFGNIHIFLGHRLEWFGGNNKNKTHIPALYHRVIHPHTAAVISIFAWAFLSPQHSERDGGILQNVKKSSKISSNWSLDLLGAWSFHLGFQQKVMVKKQNDP